MSEIFQTITGFFARLLAGLIGIARFRAGLTLIAWTTLHLSIARLLSILIRAALRRAAGLRHLAFQLIRQ